MLLPLPLLGPCGYEILKTSYYWKATRHASKFSRYLFPVFHTYTHAGLSVVGRKQVAEEEQRTWDMLSEERKKEVKVILPTKGGGGGEERRWLMRTVNYVICFQGLFAFALAVYGISERVVEGQAAARSALTMIVDSLFDGEAHY